MRIASIGHAVFAAILIAIGILGLVNGDFGAIWQPVSKGIPARAVLIYLCATISLGAGLGLLWARTAALASTALVAYLLLWFLCFRAPVILRSPGVEVSWEGAGETAVILAGAWMLHAWLAAGSARQGLGFAAGRPGVRVARILFGLALIPLGLAHLAYVKETASLVPAWLPDHSAWAHATGAAYLAAALAVLTGVRARPAAALSAWQMGLFTLLVWLPRVVAGTRSAEDWSEFVISLSLTASAWVIADSYRPGPAGTARA